MAESEISPDIQSICINERLYPLAEEQFEASTSDNSNAAQRYLWMSHSQFGQRSNFGGVIPHIDTFEEAKARAKLGVQLRQMEVMNTWKASFDYFVTTAVAGDYYSLGNHCDPEYQASSGPGPEDYIPRRISILAIMMQVFDEEYNPASINSIGGVELSEKFGTLTVLVNLTRRTYEGIMLEHSKDFNYSSAQLILSASNHPCRSEEEDAPPCQTGPALIKVGTISARTNLIKDSQMEALAVKDNLYTEIKGTILAGSLIDSRELLVAERSQIVNSTIISRHFSMNNFSTASGIQFESNGLYYLDGVKGFFATGGEDDVELSYTDPDSQEGESSTRPGLVDSVITQSPSGLTTIHNSICTDVQIETSQFHCKDTTFNSSSITLKANSGLNAEGIIEQMKVYASPFLVDAPDGQQDISFTPNGLGSTAQAAKTSAVVHTSDDLPFKAVSGNGLGDKYICENIECPEMFQPRSYYIDQNDPFGLGEVASWWANHDLCVNPLTQSGCASYVRLGGITDFRKSAAALIGTAQATVEYELTPGDGVSIPTAWMPVGTLETIPKPTYMTTDEPQALKEGIPHAIEDSTLNSCTLAADDDVYLSNVTLGGTCTLSFNKKTLVKGQLIIKSHSTLDAFAVLGLGKAETNIVVEPMGQLNTEFIDDDNINLNNMGTTIVYQQTHFGQQITNEGAGTISWTQPEVRFAHQGQNQAGTIIVNNGVFMNGGEFVYANGEVRGNSLRTEDGTGPNETRSTRQTTVQNINGNLMNVNTFSMHGPDKRFSDLLLNQNAILKIDNILLKNRSRLLVIGGLVLSSNIEASSIHLDGAYPVYDGEGKETRPTPSYPLGSPTRVNASSIKASFINFDHDTIVSGSQLIQSGSHGNRLNISTAYLKINDISLIAKRHTGRGRTSYYGALAGHVECSNLKLQSYYCGASISGGASVQFVGSTNVSSLMDGQTSTFLRSLNKGNVDNATFSNGSASIELAANSVFENSAIGGSLSGSIQATNCVGYFQSPEAITYPNHAGLFRSSAGALELLICSANFTDCNFKFQSIVDKIFRYTFFGRGSERVIKRTPDGGGGFNQTFKRMYSEQSFTAVAKTQNEAVSLVNDQITAAIASKPDYASYEWIQDPLRGVNVQGISTININNTRLACSSIAVANLNIGNNSHVYVSQSYSTGRRSHAAMEFSESPAADKLTLSGPDSSIRNAVFNTMQVPEKCYLYECKVYDVEVSDKGKTLGCYIKYGKWNGSNAFSWAGQSVDYSIENIDINTGELNQTYPEISYVQQSATAEDLMGPINENIQQLRRYTNEAVLTEPRTLEYSNLEYDSLKDITKITMPLSFVDLRNSYNKKIHYKDLILDSNSNNPIGEIIGANASLNEVYISGNIQNHLSNASGIVSSAPIESGTVSLSEHQDQVLQKVFGSYSGSLPIEPIDIEATGSLPANTGSDLGVFENPIPANTGSTSRVSPSGYSGYNLISDIPDNANTGVRIVPFSGNPTLKIQGRSGGSRIIRGGPEVNETIQAEASLAPDKTFSSFTGKNQNKQFVPSSFEEVKATVLNQAAGQSVISASTSNAHTPILDVDLVYSSFGDHIGDGEFNGVNIASHILGSQSENNPTQVNKCGGHFTLGSDSENTFFDFNGSIAWSMTITEHTTVTFNGKSYLCGEGMGVPGSLFFEGGSTNNSSLSISIGGLVRFNSSFNNANMNGGTVTFSSSTNDGDLNVQSVGLYNSTNLWKIKTDPVTTTTIENIKNLGEITSTYINAYGMSEGITELLSNSAGFSTDGRAGYFKLFSRENPPEDQAALGLYYDSVNYTIQAVEEVLEGHPGAVLNRSETADGTQTNQWVVRHAPLDVSAYFEEDSFIAQQFLLPFKGNPYSTPSRWPYIYMEETFFHQQ